MRPSPVPRKMSSAGFQSTHSLRSATAHGDISHKGGPFQSTHSLRSATMGYTAKWAFGLVSIHALLAECDETMETGESGEPGFNPRTPCGVRRNGGLVYPIQRGFQSTHSLRSATPFADFALYVLCVSIHALLAECDTPGFPGLHSFRGFNPRTPCGVRLIQK